LVALASAGCTAISATIHDQMASTTGLLSDSDAAPAVSTLAPAQPQVVAAAKPKPKAVQVLPATGSTMALRVVSMPDASSKAVTPRYVYMMEPVVSDGDNSTAPLAGEAVKTVVTEDTSQTVMTAPAPEAQPESTPAAKPKHAQAKHLYWFLSGR
jgi:hypothetical protein